MKLHGRNLRWCISYLIYWIECSTSGNNKKITGSVL